MMNKKAKSESYKVTPREFQRGLFMSSLREQLGKVADAHAKILRTARQYSSDGLSEPEVRELLIIDGFNPELVSSCLETIASDAGSYREQWGFEVEDAYGRIVSHADMSRVLEASSEDEAMAQADQIVAEGSAERVVRVFRIG